MTYGIGTLEDFRRLERERATGKISSHTVSGAIVLSITALAGAFILYGRPEPAPQKVGAPPVLRKPAPQPPAYDPLFDGSYSLGSPPAPFAKNAPLRSNFGAESFAQTAALRASVAPPQPESPMPVAEADIGPLAVPLPPPSPLVSSVPVPAPRPAEFGASMAHSPLRSAARQMTEQNKAAASAEAEPADKRNFFEKLFGISQQPSGAVLAYAAPQREVLEHAQKMASGTSLAPDRFTAVYDIAAHTVYMPNGTRLEAHSGLGNRLDDPRYVHEKNRGATPPHVYELTPREQLFHGVQALRMTPVGDGDIYGRDGLLAHTYMLGPNGDSNGCVSFRDYNAFLQAYMKGEVRRLAVVARLN